MSQKSKSKKVKEQPEFKITYEDEPDNTPQIKYLKLPGGKVMITNFENIMTREDIYKKYGEIIANCYLDNQPRMFFEIPDRIKIASEEGITFIEKENVINKERLNQLRSLMKQCGQMLHDTKEAIESGRESTIKI